MTDLEQIAASLAALAQREPHAPYCPRHATVEERSMYFCTCDWDARVAAAQARVVLDALDLVAEGPGGWWIERPESGGWHVVTEGESVGPLPLTDAIKEQHSRNALSRRAAGLAVLTQEAQ